MERSVSVKGELLPIVVDESVGKERSSILVFYCLCPFSSGFVALVGEKD